MKLFTSCLVLLLCLIMVGSTLAKEQSVYFNLGLSGADATYPDEIEKMLDLVDALPGVDRMTVGVDLGLYFPVQTGSLFGVSLSGMGDRFEVNSEHVQLNQYLIGASYRHYIGKVVGKGFFLRGDAGMARMVLDESGEETETSDWGYGFLVGGGYSFQISGGTWFSLNADFTSKTIDDETVGGVTVGGAFLF
jgi:hypothetical protein